MIESTKPCKNQQFIITNNLGSLNVPLLLHAFLSSEELGSIFDLPMLTFQDHDTIIVSE
jgi:hypothetical protein